MIFGFVFVGKMAYLFAHIATLVRNNTNAQTVATNVIVVTDAIQVV